VATQARTGRRPAFRGSPIHVRVPATSANLGPGFDALGLALTLYDDVVARIGDEGVTVDVAGEGADDVPRDESHLMIQSMRATFELLGGQPHGIELSCANRIPHGRGLGSSAAAIVGGILLARALVLGGDEKLPDSEVLKLASRLEGHPDNVAACLRGGLTIAWTDDNDGGGVGALRLDCAPQITPVVFIPPEGAATHLTRKLLPDQVSHADAAFNGARAALLVAALTGQIDALVPATQDRLHQSYRAAAMPQTAQLLDLLRDKSIAAVVSGAGPTVLALTRDQAELDLALAQTPSAWRGEVLAVDTHGAHIVQM
jgi:homoserine kinase